MADERLVLMVMRAQRGDARAFDCLVRRFQDPAVAYARSLLSNPVAAEDAAQEAFVQAWRDLPRLAEAAAFGAWLRRIVFKFCDRARRSARPEQPLSERLASPDGDLPAEAAERAETAAKVRAAVDALPQPLRETTLLYYLAGRDVREIAAFLEAPPSTVKNRLHAARKRLRKELWTMAGSVFEPEKPSQNEAFAVNVIAKALQQFQEQEAADPHTADRGLLEEGRTALVQRLERGEPLDEETVHAGFILLWRLRDWKGLAALLMRRLAGDLSDSETAWTYLHLANVIAIDGGAAGAVLAHEAFERWVPGKTLRLSANWPYFPSENAAEAAYIDEDVRVLFLSQSAEFATSYLAVWRNAEYLAKVDAALKEVPLTPQNRKFRFFMLRMAYNACASAGDFGLAQEYVRQMHLLADGAEDPILGAEIRSKAFGHEIDLARRRGDDAVLTARIEDMTHQLSEAERQAGATARWVRGERHDLACQLAKTGRHAQALPLWEANAAGGGQVNGWGWLVYAATVWKTTRDRERTLALLREARAHEDRDIQLTDRPEFADVQDDPGFLQAIRRE